MQVLLEKLFTALKNKKMKLVTAESCTGGMIGTIITSAGGASDIYERGFITYSNEAKIEMLGVAEDILHAYGAVSGQTVISMASGALAHSHADIAIAVTGIAGPNSDDSAKPVGLVYIGITMTGESPLVFEHNFEGDRAKVREQSVVAALDHALEALI